MRGEGLDLINVEAVSVLCVSVEADLGWSNCPEIDYKRPKIKRKATRA